jgi:ABC-type multidrug transport system ATPase subunit
VEPEIILELENLTKAYPSVGCVVNKVSLAIRRGEIYVLLGPNGAGKTTLFAMILGLLQPTQGSIRLCGVDLQKHPQHRSRLGGFIEEPPFYPHLSAVTNLEIAARLRGRTLEAPRLHEVLQFVGLTEAKDRPVGQFSTGMKRRLGIARAILFTPELVVLDEPTSGLDPQGAVEIRALVRQLQERLGLTILLSTHLLHEAEQLATRVGILKDGRLIREGVLEDWLVASQRYLLHVREGVRAHQVMQGLEGIRIERLEDDRFIVDLNGIAPEELNAFLVREGIYVRELAQMRNTLEDIFLAALRGDPYV